MKALRLFQFFLCGLLLVQASSCSVSYKNGLYQSRTYRTAHKRHVKKRNNKKCRELKIDLTRHSDYPLFDSVSSVLPLRAKHIQPMGVAVSMLNASPARSTGRISIEPLSNWVDNDSIIKPANRKKYHWTSPASVVSGVLGIGALFVPHPTVFWIGSFLLIAAIILGIVGRDIVRSQPEKYYGGELANAGKWIGIIGLLLLLILLLLGLIYLILLILLLL